MVSFYFNQKYIAENICINRFDQIPLCYGACFLTKKLKENNKKEEKIPNLKEKEVQLYCQELAFFDCNLDFKIQDGKNNLFYKNVKTLNLLIYSIFRPPESV